MTETHSCQPRNPEWTRQGTTDLDYEMVGRLISKKDEVLEIKYLKSNKFWDESDTFSLYGENVLVYRLDGDNGVSIGDDVLVSITGQYSDPKHERISTSDGDGCIWFYRVLEAKQIEPYKFSFKVEFTEFLKSGSAILVLGFFAIALFIFFTFLRKKEKKQK
jgi:hypothetical protein